MLIVSGSIRLKPGVRDEAAAAVIPTMEATLDEPGCTAYRFTFDLADPDLVHVYEEWADEDALAAHMATPGFAEFGAQLIAWVEGGGDFTKHTVASSASLFG